MPNAYEVLVDTDAFVGFVLPDDTHHVEASRLFAQFAAEQRRIVATSWVIAETATVLSHLDGQERARWFLQQVKAIHLPTIHITEDLQSVAEGVFIAQDKKGTSMVDCGNVAVMRQFRIPMILSFDGFYFKKFQLQQAV